MVVNKPAYLFVVDSYNAKHAKRLSPIFKGHKVFLWNRPITVLSELNPVIRAQEKKGYSIKGIICSNTAILKKLIAEKFKAKDKLGTSEALSTNYQGAIFEKKLANGTLPVLIFPELETIVFRPYGSFLCKRYFRKLWDPTFPNAPKLEWEMLHDNNAESLYKLFQSAVIMGGDIETVPMEVPFWVREQEGTEGLWLETNNRTASGGKGKDRVTVIPKITMQGYTGIFQGDDGQYTSYTVVIPANSVENIEWIKKFNELDAIKIYQNGIYDIAYHMRYGMPMKNYLYDTKQLMHSWYAELPRTLEFISAFFVRNHMYWKDEMGMDSFFYNAQDCHYMTWACLFMLNEMPEWAKNNYKENFPKVFPSIQCAMDGLLIDEEEHARLHKAEIKKWEDSVEDIEVLTNTKWFNASSAKQVIALLNLLGYPTDKSDDKTIQAFREKNELNSVIGEAIINVRKSKKAIGNYFEIDLFNHRYMYAIDNAGTDTGRFASNGSAFWCGGNIQNIPLYAKSMFIPDDGWEFGAIDNSQSESRCTAYISEDENLMDTVENAKDFHVRNAALFFALEEAYLFDLKAKGKAGDAEAKKKFETYRNKLGKRINHGANYNMGAGVLLSNMGAKAVIEAGHALELPREWALLDICAHLLNLFDKTYPLIRDLHNPNSYYRRVVKEIEETSMLVGPTGWTRYCFSKPVFDANWKPKNKNVLNSYVAHPPQSLSVKMINDSFFKAWKKLQIQENKIRMKAQVHDENFFMHRKGLSEEELDYIYNTISGFMEEPVMVNGRKMVIPNDQVRCKSNWKECK